MMSFEIKNITVLNINGLDYRFIIVGIIKSEAINLLKNANLSDKSGSLWDTKIFNFFLIIKMS